MEVPVMGYSVEEAARALGISRNTAYALVAEGRIPSLRLGRRLIVPKAALERMLAEGGQHNVGKG